MNNIPGLSLIILSTVLTLFTGCASQPKIPSEQMLNKYPDVSKLASELQKAQTSKADLLAPGSYERASDSLQSALSAAEKNNDEAIRDETAAGLNAIKKLNSDVEISNDLLAEVLQVRDRALAAGIQTLEKQKISDMDQDLKATSALIEEGKFEQAKKSRPKLLDGYSQLELIALKQGTANLARSSIAEAKSQGAENYAPKTLARAEESLALAVTILDNDRTQTEKADQQSRKARWLAEQSAVITETVKDFDRRDYSLEDIVLWHQQQLSLVNQPLGGELAFNKPDNKAVQDLKNAIAKLVKEKDMALANSLAAEEKYAQQLASSEQKRRAEQNRELENRRKFERVQAMFKSSEANVFRQREDVLISAHGLQFASGQSEIQTVNFPLMSKITEAIRIFPDAKIQVSGHTDSIGDDGVNRIISEARAIKIAKFLVELGGIKAKNISAIGYGESRPVATNDTKQGRAENRRVEIKIINQ